MVSVDCSDFMPGKTLYDDRSRHDPCNIPSLHSYFFEAVASSGCAKLSAFPIYSLFTISSYAHQRSSTFPIRSAESFFLWFIQVPILYYF